MNTATSDNIVGHIENTFSKNGIKLTQNRKKILQLMASKQKALSAYEISDLLKEIYKTSTPTMSVYRALDFLEQKELIHKISTLNKYTLCSHILCEHKHEITQLLICLKCSKTIESSSNKSLNTELSKNLISKGFHPNNKLLEIQGTCSECYTR